MRGIPLCGALVLAAALAPAPAAAQGPPVAPPTGVPQPGVSPPDQPAASGTGSIRGRVVRADTGAAFPGVDLQLSGAVSRRATSDDEGRYEFTDLPAGRFALRASKDRHVTVEYGQRSPSEPGRRIALSEGETLTLDTLAMPRHSAIAGRVTDEFGDPVTGLQIRIERARFGPGGQRQLETFTAGAAVGPFVMTDDRGEYRLFGLMPGRYYVSGRVQALNLIPGPAGARDVADTFLPTYYPGTADLNVAQAIEVGVAEEVAANFSMVPGRMLRISGRVTNSLGRPAAGLHVFLSIETANSSGSRDGGPVQADGSFSFGNVPPGDYTLRVRDSGGGRGPDAEVGSLPIVMQTEDLVGLHLTTRRGTTIRGTVEWEGSAPRPRSTRISTSSSEPSRGPVGEITFTYLDPASGTVQDDDTFELGGIIGSVLFQAVSPPWRLKSVTADGSDITHTGVDAASLGGDTRIRIVMTDRSTNLSGSVRDSRGQPVDSVVVVLPEQPMEGMAATRFTRTVRPDHQGAFRIAALPPGRYVAAAVEGIEPGGEWDPAFQQTVRATGRAFTLADGQELSLELELLP